MEIVTHKISEDLETFRWNLQVLKSDEIIKIVHGFPSREDAENYFTNVLNESQKLIESMFI